MNIYILQDHVCWNVYYVETLSQDLLYLHCTTDRVWLSRFNFPTVQQYLAKPLVFMMYLLPKI